MAVINIAQELLNGSRLALARAITAVENEYPAAPAIMKDIFPATGRAQVVGITGPPGSGKSTLTDKMAKHYRQQGKTVGIIAVDPTSPFSGGAILGDRIRMNELTLDEGVFIRSMGTRGSLGGLSRKTADAVKLMDAFGKDVILVETVGVGQSEVDIAKAADTTLVVLVPGLGDDIQAIKAGILEIGDIFVINKADRDGADKVKVEIEMMLDLNSGVLSRGEGPSRRPPVCLTVASRGEGVEELAGRIGEHAVYLADSTEGEMRRLDRIENELTTILTEKIQAHILNRLEQTVGFHELARRILCHEENPYDWIEMALPELLADRFQNEK